MSLAAKLLSASGGVDKLYVDDVFSTYTYTGNGSTQTINNGIDLAGKGGLVWTKGRTLAGGQPVHHILTNTIRGLGNRLSSNLTDAEYTNSDITGFTSTGFQLSYVSAWSNYSSTSYTSWTFRKAPKFFDVVTWTGTGANRTISHSLGQVPGMIIVKRTDAVESWCVYHKSLANTQILELESTNAVQTLTTAWNSTTPTSSVFAVGTSARTNANAGTYVAYLFAHDTSADGLIQCGSFTTNGSGNATVNLGWEPQYVLIKPTSTTGNWIILDTMRGWVGGGTSGLDKPLFANTSGSEDIGDYGDLTATGFTTSNIPASSTHIYLAIRRPNKPPTSGTQVYNAIARTGTGAAATVTGVGFAPDLLIPADRGATYSRSPRDRLRGTGPAGAMNLLLTTGTGAESYDSGISALDSMDGFSCGAGNYGNASGVSFINYAFKRAPEVFDVVCYTGISGTNYIRHNLGSAPEIVILKNRTSASDFVVIHVGYGIGWGFKLNTNDMRSFAGSTINSEPDSSGLWLGNSIAGNNNTSSHVAYLFASKAGISKCGKYTGNGSTQTINCGFTTGARFILIKSTEMAGGDWYVWDTVRGIVSGNDLHLSLNTTASEVTTDDSIDPATSGFVVNQLAATSINFNGATYIYLAFA